MFDFNQVLMENEEILYEGKPTPGKGDKRIGSALFVIAFIIMTCAILIWSTTTSSGDGATGITNDFITIMLVFLGIGGLTAYSLIYNTIIKKKAVADDIYCLTNLRALKYETTTQKLTYGYLMKYDQIEVQNYKDGFGDVYMGIIFPGNAEPNQQTQMLKETIFNKNPNDMPFMNFQSVANPYEIMQMALQTHQQLLINFVQNQQNNMNNYNNINNTFNN